MRVQTACPGYATCRELRMRDVVILSIDWVEMVGLLQRCEDSSNKRQAVRKCKRTGKSKRILMKGIYPSKCCYDLVRMAV